MDQLEGLEWEEFAEFPDDSQASKSPVLCLPNGFAVVCDSFTFTKNTIYNALMRTGSQLPSTPEALQNQGSVFCFMMLCTL